MQPLPWPFQLLLCSGNADLARRASEGGLDGAIVDWERYGRPERPDTTRPVALPANERFADPGLPDVALAQLRSLRAATRGLLIARLNRCGPWTRAEIEAAVAGGADEVLLTMVRSVEEVADALRWAAGRCRVGIVAETLDALHLAPRLAGLPLARVHIGLKDLAAARGEASMFSAVADGTAEAIRQAFRVPVGFAGLTLPELGDPIPCRLLIGEMVRMGCGFAMLGASFHRDVAGRDPEVEIARLKRAIADAGRRSPGEVRKDREALEAVLAGLQQAARS